MKKIISLILCLFWMGLIFYNSSQTGEESNLFSNKVLNRIKSEINGTAYDNNSNSFDAFSLDNVKGDFGVTDGNSFVRKNAHAFEYLVLAILFAITLKQFGFKNKNAVIYILFGVLFYAVTDEYHQLYVPGRGSSVRDVIIDFIGGVFGVILFNLLDLIIIKLKNIKKYVL